jgi:hypothetical protein
LQLKADGPGLDGGIPEKYPAFPSQLDCCGRQSCDLLLGYCCRWCLASLWPNNKCNANINNPWESTGEDLSNQPLITREQRSKMLNNRQRRSKDKYTDLVEISQAK